MVRDEPQSERDVVKRAIDAVRSRMPLGWKLDETYEVSRPDGRRIDATLQITAPDGARARLVFEAKRIIERRDVVGIVNQLKDYLGDGDVPVVAGKYLNPQVRADLQQQGISYVDATGNILITAQSPALYLADRGEDRDPWRGKGRPRGTLRGEPAARVVRALLDFDKAWGIRDLIETSKASTGATYRVLEYLEQETLAARGADGLIRVPDWKRLLEVWAGDTTLGATSKVARYIEPRGLESFATKLRASEDYPYVVTGSIAASEWAPYAPARAAYVYVESIDGASERWDLRPAEASPNVILCEPRKPDDVAFDRAVMSSKGYRIAAPTQVAADLLNGPGRNPSEAEELLAWMSANEGAWRK